MTEPMFAMDQRENDRLLLQEAQRRQALIDQAVSSFAPHLAGKPNVKAIHIYSANASLRKAVRELGGGRTIVVEHCEFTGRERKGVNEIQHNEVRIPMPATADLVVTRSGLNFRTELLAAQLKAQAVVMPEGSDYILGCLEKSGLLVIVGSDMGKQ